LAKLFFAPRKSISTEIWLGLGLHAYSINKILGFSKSGNVQEMFIVFATLSNPNKDKWRSNPHCKMPEN